MVASDLVTVSSRLGPWDDLFASYLAAVPRVGPTSRYARSVARAERAVDATAGFVRWANVGPAAVTVPLLTKWLARPGPRPYPVKLERRAVADILSHAVDAGMLTVSPLEPPGEWRELLKAYVADSDGTASTLESHSKRVASFARWAGVPPLDVEEDLVAGYLAANPSWSEATRTSARTSLRVVLGFGAEAGFLNTNPAKLLPVLAAGSTRPWVQIAVGARAERDDRGAMPHLDPRAFPQHPSLRWAEATGRPGSKFRGRRGGAPNEDLLSEWVAAGSPVMTFTDDPVTAAWDCLCVSYAERAAAAGRLTSTIHQRYQAMMRFARWAGVAPIDVTEATLVRYLSNPDWTARYRHAERSALRAVLRVAFKMGHIVHDPSAELDSIRVPLGVPRAAPEAAVSMALAGITHQVRIMILLAALAGCRRAEIAVLRVDAITDDGLRIIGKGGKVRLVPIHLALAPELNAYLRATGIREGYIFPGDDNGHMSPQHLGRLVSAALKGPWATHSLRHRFGTRAYAGAFDIRAVQELLGHASPGTTAGYVAVPNTALVNAVAAIPPIPGMGPPPGTEDDDAYEDRWDPYLDRDDLVNPGPADAGGDGDGSAVTATSKSKSSRADGVSV